MSQTGYTPILIYGSGTTTNVPSTSNLTTGATGVELALNYTDGKLFYKDNNGTLQVLATSGVGNNITWSYGNLSAVIGGTAALQVPSGTTANRPGATTLTTANLTLATGGVFAVSPALSTALTLNQAVVITGTLTGTATITGYTSGNTYYVIATSTSSFTLSSSLNGTAITTTAGTVTGLAFTLGSPNTAMFRYNTTLSQFEGYNGTAWGGIGGGLGGGSILTNTTTVTTNATISSGTNGLSVGPVTINNGITVTVANGQRWLIL